MIMDKQILAFYATSNIFSGQRIAFELVLQGISSKGWEVSVINTPAFDRTEKNVNRHLNLLIQLIHLLPRVLYSWFKFLFYGHGKLLCVCLGLTKIALIREGLPILLGNFFFPENKSIISLNGSNIMFWEYNSFETKLFRLISQSSLLSIWFLLSKIIPIIPIIIIIHMIPTTIPNCPYYFFDF